MKTITLQVTEEQEKKILEALGKRAQGKWVPAEGQDYWHVDLLGQIFRATNRATKFDNDIISHNNAFQTKEQAERQSLRRQGAERRCLPKHKDSYKTLDMYDFGITRSIWVGDEIDWVRYHLGMVWHIDTPDSEIKAWIEKYKDAWCHE